MAEDVNRETVERRLARLQEAWGTVEVERREEMWAPQQFDESLELARSGYTGGAYVCAVREPGQAAPLTESMPDGATQDAPRVLLGMGRNADQWGPPGGGREDGETYEEAAVREVREETGVDVELTGLSAALRWTTTGEERDDTVHTLFVTFEGCYVGGHVEIQPGELNGAAWFRELPANLHQFAEPFAERWDGGRVGPGRSDDGR